MGNRQSKKRKAQDSRDAKYDSKFLLISSPQQSLNNFSGTKLFWVEVNKPIWGSEPALIQVDISSIFVLDFIEDDNEKFSCYSLLI